MEDVLDLYAEPHAPARPVVCFDETRKQLVTETRTSLPMAPGKPERVDYEHERHGTADLFLVTQPLGAWRHVDVTDRRTKHDFAQQMRGLVDRHFPDATIRVVLDNLNTHTPAALYEAFPPAEARRLLRKLDFHCTPVHGSWLNMAEVRRRWPSPPPRSGGGEGSPLSCHTRSEVPTILRPAVLGMR
jgi:hypothetical protein